MMISCLACRSVACPIAFVVCAALINGAIVAAQAESSAAFEVRQALRAVRSSLGADARAKQISNLLGLDDVQRELYAELDIETVTLQQAVKQLTTAPAAEFRQAEYQRLATALESYLAELQRFEPDSLPALCRDIAAMPLVVTSDQLVERQADLRRDLARFDSRLKTLGAQESKWRDFLLWQELATVATEQTFDLPTLDRLEVRWTNAPLAWNDPDVLALASSVRSLVRTARAFQLAEPQTESAQAWSELASLLEIDQAALSGEQRLQIEKLFSERVRLGQAPQLLAAITQDLSYPNMVVTIDPGQLQRHLARPLDERFPINAIFGGSRATGNGRLTGNLNCVMLPSASAGRWALQLEATSTSSTVALDSGVRVQSRSTTSIAGERRFTLDATGLYAGAPTSSARTNLIYDSITSGGRAIRRNAAENQVRARRVQAQADASAAAERAARDRLRSETDPAVEQFNAEYRRYLRDEWVHSKSLTPRIRVRGTSSELIWQCRLNGLGEFAAPSPPPQLSPGGDAAVAVHTSFVERHCQVVWGGERFTAAELLGELRALLGEAAVPFDESADWTLTFAPQPVTLTTSAGNLHFQLHVAKLDDGGTVYPEFTCEATYAMQAEEGALRLKRQGTLRVVFATTDAATGPGSGRQQTLRLAVQRRLGRVFAADLVIERFPLGTIFGQSSSLRTASATAKEGWLQWVLSAKDPGNATGGGQ